MYLTSIIIIITIELKIKYNIKMTVIPIAIGVLGTNPKDR